jgi:hypothetical protein
MFSPAAAASRPITDACSVSLPPVAAGKVTAAALVALVGADPEIVQPPDDRATATRE